MTVNPITLEIVRNSLVMAAEQIAARMIRSATSMIVKEMEDCSAAIFDGDGRLLSESASIPIHLNCIGLCLRTILDHYIPLDEWEEGDVVLTNDPYAGGGSLSSHHTNDVIAYTPVFWNGRRVAFAALNVHHMDVGATWMGTRGWNLDIEQEGLRVPPCKIVRRGELDLQLFRVMLANTRVPENFENDLVSQFASIRLATDEVTGLFDRYGVAEVLAIFDELVDYSERRTRQEIARIPDGVYRHEEPVLDDGAKGGPFWLRLQLTVSGDELTFDFTGTDPQIKGPINAPLSATHAAVFYVMRCITDPSIPNTEGCKKPVRIVAPAGSLVNAQWPAACFQRMVVCHSIVDLVMGALAEAVPGRVMGDSCGCLYNNTMLLNPRSGRRTSFGEVVPGGIGATARGDGASALSAHVTNCPIPPIEALEIDNPVLYVERRLSTDSGGPGRWRGGLGQVLGYRILGDDPQFHHTSQKTVSLPQGVAGGQPGDGGRWVVNEGSPRERTLRYAIGDIEFLENGDVVTHYSPGGGGYGDPAERPLDLIERDLRLGYETIAHVEAHYGVRVCPDTLQVTRRP